MQIHVHYNKTYCTNFYWLSQGHGIVANGNKSIHIQYLHCTQCTTCVHEGRRSCRLGIWETNICTHMAKVQYSYKQTSQLNTILCAKFLNINRSCTADIHTVWHVQQKYSLTGITYKLQMPNMFSRSKSLHNGINNAGMICVYTCIVPSSYAWSIWIITSDSLQEIDTSLWTWSTCSVSILFKKKVVTC